MLVPDIDFDTLNHVISQIEVVVVHVLLGYFGIKHLIARPMHSKPEGIGLRQRTLEEIREELRKMSDNELRKHGRSLREFCKPDHTGEVNEDWLRQLNEARAEWKRRHPKPPLSKSVKML
jgi:hypothetical protein